MNPFKGSFILFTAVLMLGIFFLNGCFTAIPSLPSLEDGADFEVLEEENGAEEELEFFEEVVKGQNAELRGKVKDSKTKDPIEGVTLTLVEAEFVAVTDGDGFYRFTEVPAGKYTLRAEKEGYRNYTRTVTLRSGTRRTLSFTMRSKNATLKGTVKDDRGRSLSGVSITIEGPYTFSTQTNSRGQYSFSNVPPGVYTFQATKEGYEDFKKAITLKPTRTTVLNVLRMKRIGGTALWTVMVYMAADNSLSPYSLYDLQEMERVGSNEQLSVVVFLDRKNQSAGYYYILPGSEQLLQTIGSADSGNGDTLRDFIQFAKEKYPAQRYALILWNHGSGWRTPKRGICFDDSAGFGGITLPELAVALQAGGVHFDLIGMDACLMAMVEVAYEIRNYGDFLVASQGLEPGAGWDYAAFLRRLKTNPTMSTQALAEEIMNGYFSFYPYGSDLTLSVINLSRVGNLAATIDQFARIARSDTSFQKFRSVSPAWPYIDTQIGSVDIYHCVQLLLENCTTFGCSPDLIQSLQNVQQQLASTVIKNRASGTYQGARGLSIYLPSPCPVENTYSPLAFARDTAWDDFLAWWCSD